MEGGGKAPVPEEHGDTSAKAAAAAAALEVASASGGRSRAASRGLAVLDLILRFVAVIGTVGSAIAMGTTNQTLPFFTQFLLFKAQYDDLPTLTFFVVVNSIVAAYLVLSIPLSIVHIIRSRAKYSRLVLVFFDAHRRPRRSCTWRLAHKGNARANWFAICQQFDAFCKRISGSLIGSFVAMALLVLLVVLSAAALARR
ncbi:unnamed protein product [Urochloa decumbens]|uniref:CASP-like protein n=1 Tax=Urochloa decumbens TaxID=240449 RepID=A0ABC9EC98_9POAL